MLKSIYGAGNHIIIEVNPVILILYVDLIALLNMVLGAIGAPSHCPYII